MFAPYKIYFVYNMKQRYRCVFFQMERKLQEIILLIRLFLIELKYSITTLDDCERSALFWTVFYSFYIFVYV